MTRPRLLDLCGGAGVGAMGYHRAGFEVVGVDIEPQPHYPFAFHQADALAFLREHGHEFDAVHASPPCQAKTTMSNRWRGKGGKADSHVNLIPATRELLLLTGLPYVIENVPGARSDLRDPIVLTGGMFGLRVHRPRLFETNWQVTAPASVPAPRDSIGVYGKAPDGRLLWRRADGSEQRAAASVSEAREAMGVDWALPDWRGIAESIPPAYTDWIGRQLAAVLAEEVAA